jgi:hypothetical protein
MIIGIVLMAFMAIGIHSLTFEDWSGTSLYEASKKFKRVARWFRLIPKEKE